jgi:hypothetical protein
MITMQQLEELESRIIKALQLIGDLRVENSRLESDNENLKSVAEEAKLSLEEKEQEIVRIQRELDDTVRELAALKDKEEVLEKKLIELLGKMDTLKVGSSPVTPAPRPAPEPRAAEKSTPPPAASRIAAEPEMEREPFRDVNVEVVKAGDDMAAADKDDDIIIIDDDTAMADGDIAIEPARKKGEPEDEIILIDDAGEDIIIDDVDRESVIIDETEKPAPKKAEPPKKKQSFDVLESDDDFLIIEEDK